MIYMSVTKITLYFNKKKYTTSTNKESNHLFLTPLCSINIFLIYYITLRAEVCFWFILACKHIFFFLLSSFKPTQSPSLKSMGPITSKLHVWLTVWSRGCQSRAKGRPLIKHRLISGFKLRRWLIKQRQLMNFWFKIGEVVDYPFNPGCHQQTTSLIIQRTGFRILCLFISSIMN